jgi:hypothetical protein
VEDEGVLAAGSPRQLWHPRREPAAGVVERARDVRLVAPLVVPSIPKSQIHGEGQSPNRRRLEQHFTGGGARVPDVDDGKALVPAHHGHQLRRRHVRYGPRHPHRAQAVRSLDPFQEDESSARCDQRHAITSLLDRAQPSYKEKLPTA